MQTKILTRICYHLLITSFTISCILPDGEPYRYQLIEIRNSTNYNLKILPYYVNKIEEGEAISILKGSIHKTVSPLLKGNGYGFLFNSKDSLIIQLSNGVNYNLSCNGILLGNCEKNIYKFILSDYIEEDVNLINDGKKISKVYKYEITQSDLDLLN